MVYVWWRRIHEVVCSVCERWTIDDQGSVMCCELRTTACVWRLVDDVLCTMSAWCFDGRTFWWINLSTWCSMYVGTCTFCGWNTDVLWWRAKFVGWMTVHECLTMDDICCAAYWGTMLIYHELWMSWSSGRWTPYVGWRVIGDGWWMMDYGWLSQRSVIWSMNLVWFITHDCLIVMGGGRCMLYSERWALSDRWWTVNNVWRIYDWKCFDLVMMNTRVVVEGCLRVDVGWWMMEGGW